MRTVAPMLALALLEVGCEEEALRPCDPTLCIPCDGDVAAPVLRTLTIEPTTIDTSLSAQRVVLRARFTDGSAGVASWYAAFLGPGDTHLVSNSSARLTSGTRLDGEWQIDFEVPHLSQQGTWKLNTLELTDCTDNRASLPKLIPNAALRPSFEQTGAGDSAGPVVRSFSLSPTSIDTSSSDQQVIVTTRVTDDLSGVEQLNVAFAHEGGVQYAYGSSIGADRDGGTDLDRTYVFPVTVLRYAPPGVWTVKELRLVDRVKNTTLLSAADLADAGYPTAFAQIGPGDSTAPRLRAFSFEPATVQVPSDGGVHDAGVVFTAHVTDDLVGVYDLSLYLRTARNVHFWHTDNLRPENRIFGTDRNGVYRFELSLVPHPGYGTWEVEQVHLSDKFSNSLRLSAAELADAGMPTTFTVTP